MPTICMLNTTSYRLLPPWQQSGNSRCSAVQVRKQKYPATEHAEAMSRGEEAMNGERYNIFRFNSGKQG